MTGEPGIPPAAAGVRRGPRSRLSLWAHDAVRPAQWTFAAVAVGFAGVMVAERASTIAPVALPLLLATGLMGALVRDGWGGAGWTWVGGALAEAFGGLAYLASRPATDAQWDGLVPLFLAGGVMLFAGLFFAAVLVTSTLRRLLSRRSADRAIAACVVGLILIAIIIGVSTPAGGGPGLSPAPPQAAGSRILRA